MKNQSVSIKLDFNKSCFEFKPWISSFLSKIQDSYLKPFLVHDIGYETNNKTSKRYIHITESGRIWVGVKWDFGRILNWKALSVVHTCLMPKIYISMDHNPEQKDSKISTNQYFLCVSCWQVLFIEKNCLSWKMFLSNMSKDCFDLDFI